MKYISTRGKSPALNFEDVMLAGLASDGGLYVPENLPKFSLEEIASWKNLNYRDLAFIIMQPFVADTFTDAELKELIDNAYSSFKHPAVAPLVQIDRNKYVLELFHGPTLAFKDFALQMLGQMLDKVLGRRDEKVVIMGATSGDTGSAAIEGCRRCENVDIFILHPHNRVSDVQRKQMTTVLADNVWNLAIEGNFDDCQNIVKASFGDQAFLPDGRRLVAVNSINWARIMAQIVYYFYASLSVGGPERKVSFSVPTGNFGDIFAGYLAKHMGLPVDDLIIATNTNDTLDRILKTAVYDKGQLVHTLSPSMDISISSNFERLMFDLYDRNGADIGRLMTTFKTSSITLNEQAMSRLKEEFSSGSCNDDLTCQTISELYKNTAYLLDPHSATGVAVASEINDGTAPVICLATAHPAKFSEAIEKSGVDTVAKVPPHLSDLFEREERYTVLENSAEKIQHFVASEVSAKS